MVLLVDVDHVRTNPDGLSDEAREVLNEVYTLSQQLVEAFESLSTLVRLELKEKAPNTGH